MSPTLPNPTTSERLPPTPRQRALAERLGCDPAERYVELFNAGHSDNEIADMFGVSMPTLYTWKRGWGLFIVRQLCGQ